MNSYYKFRWFLGQWVTYLEAKMCIIFKYTIGQVIVKQPFIRLEYNYVYEQI